MAHKILSSKHKIIYTFIVYLLTLFIFNNENYLYCMMEDEAFLEGLDILENDSEFRRQNDARVEEFLKRVAEKTKNRPRIFVGELKGVHLLPERLSEEYILYDSCKLREQMFDMSNETPEEIAEQEEMMKELKEVGKKCCKKKYKK